MAIELYPHNQSTYEKMIEMFKSSNRVGVVQPTGTGKSFLYLKWIEDHPQDSFVILSPSTEIFTQLLEYAENSGAPDLLKSVQMISYQALLRITDEEVQGIHPDKMVLDEFHRTGAELWGPSLQRLLDANSHTQVLGASATPVRYLDDSKDMASEIFDRNLAVEMTLGEAVQRKILSTPTYVPVWYDIDGKMDRYMQDVAQLDDGQKRREIEEKLEHLKRQLENSYGAEDIFRKYMPHDHGKYIVFCRSREHLAEMQPAMRNWLSGVNSNVRSYVSISAQEDKDLQLQAFKDDQSEDAIKLLFTIDRLNEGLHVKGIDGVIMLRPTISPIIYLQQMGRALSVNHDKPIIFDMVNNYQSVQVPMKDGSSMNVFEKEFAEAMAQTVDTEAFRIFDEMAQFTALFSELNDTLYPSFRHIWQKNLNLYKAYKAEFGCEPKHGEVYRSVSLGSWTSTQRQAFKNGTLSEERIQQLLECGFVFDPHESTWQKNFNLYKAFKADFDYEPIRGELYQGVDLGRWVAKQRGPYLRGALSEDRKQQLLECGFICDPVEAAWQENFNLYKAYKAEFGCEPKNKEVYRSVSLGSWIKNQRTAFKKGTLPAERTQQLLACGFVFDPYESTWQENFNLYKAYKTEFGCEPKHGEVYRSVLLGFWVKNQRQAFKNGTLSEERTQQLLACGFVFDPYESTWQENFNLYKAYKAEFGCDPKSREIYRGVDVGSWVMNQRADFKNGTLSEERIQQLLACRFVFDPLESAWQEKFYLYKAYKAEFGYEPKCREVYHGVELGFWVSHQRHSFKKGSLSAEKIQMLQAVGFVFPKRTLDDQISDASSCVVNFQSSINAKKAYS